MTLSHLTADDPFIADGGLETVLDYLDGIELPDFASFPLLDTEQGRASLVGYYTTYVQLAQRLNRGLVLDTPTWRASLDWGSVAGTTPTNSRASTAAPLPWYATSPSTTPRSRSSSTAPSDHVVTSSNQPCRPAKPAASTPCRPGRLPTPAQT